MELEKLILGAHMDYNVAKIVVALADFKLKHSELHSNEWLVYQQARSVVHRVESTETEEQARKAYVDAQFETIKDLPPAEFKAAVERMVREYNPAPVRRTLESDLREDR